MANQDGWGGEWTEQKLAILRGYLEAYLKVMANQRGRFRIAYIDAFAGTGYRRVRNKARLAGLNGLFDEEVQQYREGSARIAVDLNPGFDAYLFIEKDKAHCEELLNLASERPESDIRVLRGDANAHLLDLANRDWSHRRAVLFLDPYGMQVDWSTYEAIARTKAIDLWVLVPLGVAPNRMLPARLSQLDNNRGWRRKLDRFFGTSEWPDYFYAENVPHPDAPRQRSIFGGYEPEPEQEPRKVISAEDIGHFFIHRLRSVFPCVSDNYRMLRNKTGQPLYMLCFATANPSPKVQGIALRIADHLLKAG